MSQIKKTAICAMTAALLSLPTLSSAKNGFLVAPGRLQINVEELKTHSFIITNTGDNPIRLSVEPIYLAIDNPTMNAGTHLSPGVAEKENIVEKIRVSPKRLSLKPGQRRDIRVQIMPLIDKAAGDYRAHILVKMEENAYKSSQKVEGKDSMEMDLKIKMETAVALYGRKDNPVVDLSMTCEKLPSGVAKVTITNPTDWRFEGRIMSDHTPETPLVMLRESFRVSTFNVPLDANESVFRVTDVDGEVVSKTTCTEK